jgi:hypothetical protein
MNILRAGSLGLGALMFGSSAAFAQESENTATIIVRIDDRRAHELTQPWVSLTYLDGLMLDALALDNGEDPEDGVAGDHLYICRLEVPAGEDVEVWILDSGPLNSGELVYEARVNLKAGRTQRVTMRAAGPSPGSATSVSSDDASPSTTASGGEDAPTEDVQMEEPNEPEMDPSLGFAHEATVTPSRTFIRRWKSRDVYGLVGLTGLGLLIVGLGRRLSKRLIQQLDACSSLIDTLDGSVHARRKPRSIPFD